MLYGHEEKLKVGQRIDALDSEEVWSPATITKVQEINGKKEVRIKYDGWGDEWDEWVNVAAKRLAPLHQFSRKSLCWVKLADKKLPPWPATVLLRRPLEGSAQGETALRAEDKLLVKPFRPPAKYLEKGIWLDRRRIVAFHDKSAVSYAACRLAKFKPALDEALRSKVRAAPIEFAQGTLLAGASATFEPASEADAAVDAAIAAATSVDLGSGALPEVTAMAAPAAGAPGKRPASGSPAGRAGKRAKTASGAAAVYSAQDEGAVSEADSLDDTPAAAAPAAAAGGRRPAPGRFRRGSWAPLETTHPRQGKGGGKRGAPPLPKTTRGVSETAGKRWTSYLSYEGQRVHIGTFNSKAEAVVRHDLACLELWGEKAASRINHPLSRFEKVKESGNWQLRKDGEAAASGGAAAAAGAASGGGGSSAGGDGGVKRKASPATGLSALLVHATQAARRLPTVHTWSIRDWFSNQPRTKGPEQPDPSAAAPVGTTARKQASPQRFSEKLRSGGSESSITANV